MARRKGNDGKRNGAEGQGIREYREMGRKRKGGGSEGGDCLLYTSDAADE